MNPSQKGARCDEEIKSGFDDLYVLLGWVFMYADRNILSPVMGSIGEEWGLNNTELGLMSTVFSRRMLLCKFPPGFGGPVRSG